MTKALACETVEARLTALLDRELTLEDAAAVQAHLDNCAACRQAWAELVGLADLSGRWTEGGTPDLWPAIQAQVAPDALEAVLAELRALRAEVALLRRELAARPAPTPSRLLFPHGTPALPASRQIV